MPNIAVSPPEFDQPGVQSLAMVYADRQGAVRNKESAWPAAGKGRPWPTAGSH